MHRGGLAYHWENDRNAITWPFLQLMDGMGLCMSPQCPLLGLHGCCLIECLVQIHCLHVNNLNISVDIDNLVNDLWFNSSTWSSSRDGVVVLEGGYLVLW